MVSQRHRRGRADERPRDEISRVHCDLERIRGGDILQKDIDVVLSDCERHASGAIRTAQAVRLIAPRGPHGLESKLNVGHGHREHHDPQSRRRSEGPALYVAGREWSIEGRGRTANPRDVRAQVGFPRPCENHPRLLRAVQGRGSSVAVAYLGEKSVGNITRDGVIAACSKSAHERC